MKVLLFGEPLIRLTPLSYQSVDDGAQVELRYGGSEVNVARTLQGYQIQTKMLTALPHDPLGKSFEAFLKRAHIDTSALCYTSGRLGTYYLENGYGCRQSEVIYDRSFSAIHTLDPASINMDTLFEGITHFHFSGITVALSDSVRQLLDILLKEAKKRQIIISMDLNLRTKLISALDAKYLFSHYARYADYCFGIDPIMINEQDTTMFERSTATLDMIKNRMQQLQEAYNFKAIFHTMRTTDDNGQNVYQAYGLQENDFAVSVQMKTAVLERVGSGDAFVGGALTMLLAQASLKECLDFAVASATLKCTIAGDSMVEPTEKVTRLLSQGHDILR